MFFFFAKERAHPNRAHPNHQPLGLTCKGRECRGFNFFLRGGWEKGSIDIRHSYMEERYLFVSCSCLPTMGTREGRGYVATLILPHNGEPREGRVLQLYWSFPTMGTEKAGGSVAILILPCHEEPGRGDIAILILPDCGDGGGLERSILPHYGDPRRQNLSGHIGPPPPWGPFPAGIGPAPFRVGIWTGPILVGDIDWPLSG